ncbi:MAG: 50S ribosomal protein L40e [Thermodesulfobacteriota bacterium]|nr:MAG: 50S ribosomal protein L40e [Thermodesulfobacteriota bacterium]
MVRFKEAEARIFQGIFICRKCKGKARATSLKVKAGKVKCRKCGSRALRPKKKEFKKA